MRLLVVALIFTQLGCSKVAQPENGVYVSPRHVYAFHSEVLELKNGKYRYWMLSDTMLREPFQRSGRYRRENGRILMEGDKESPGDREILLDGADFRLLRDDASEIWRKEGRLYPYGTLTRVPFLFEEMCPSPNFNKKEWEILLPKLPSLPKYK